MRCVSCAGQLKMLTVHICQQRSFVLGENAEAEDDDGWMETQGGSLDAEIARREEEVRQHASGGRKAADRGRQQQQQHQAGGPSRDGGADSGSDGDGDQEGGGGASTQEKIQVRRPAPAGHV